MRGRIHDMGNGMRLTFNAATTCSGEIVFFEPFSHMSFASEDMRCMNSVHHVEH